MNIFNLLLSLFDLGGATLNQARIAYDRVVRFLLIVVLPALLFSYFLNICVSLWGAWNWLSYIPYLLGLVITAVFIIIAFLPEVMLGVGVTSRLSNDVSWTRYKELVWLIVAWINIPFMFVGGVPGGANPLAVFAIITCVTLIAIVGKHSIWRKVVVWSAIGILSINLFSLLSPAFLSPSLNRWTENKKNEVVNVLDKDSLKSEKESGIFAKTNAKTTAYNKDYQPVHQFEAGDMVMVLDTKGATADKNGEGAAHVMWANPAGDFVAGNTGYIPTRTLDWDWQKAKASPTPTPAPPTTVVYVPQPAPVVVQKTVVQPVAAQKEIWNLRCYQNNQLLEQNVSVLKSESGIIMEATVGGTIFRGILHGNSYEGKMEGGGSNNGSFSIQFISSQEAVGSWIIDQPVNFTMKRLS